MFKAVNTMEIHLFMQEELCKQTLAICFIVIEGESYLLEKKHPKLKGEVRLKSYSQLELFTTNLI